MCMVDIQSATAEIRRGKKEVKEEEDRNHRATIINIAQSACLKHAQSYRLSVSVLHCLSAL